MVKIKCTARSGVFLQSEDGVSVTTAKHVASCATDGRISYENADEKITFLGKVDKRTTKTSQTHDIAIVNIDKENASFCVNEVADPDGTRRQCKLFNGKRNELYGKQVFKCLPISKAENTTRLHIYDKKNSLIGKIASAEVHSEHGALLNNDVQFLVEGQNAAFSHKGESGAAVAIADFDQEDLAIIVGFISGEIAETRLTVCLSAQSSLKFLSKKNKLNYELLGQTVDLHADKERTSVTQQSNIHCGLKLFFDMHITNTTSLWEHVLALILISCKDMFDADITMLNNYENWLNERIDHRRDIDNSTVSGHGEFPLNTIKHCRKAWQKIHQHEFENAEKDLQCVSYYLRERSRYDLFLIFKLLSVCTFLYIERNELEIAKELIDRGLDSLEDVRHLNGFPKEIEAFLYCAYAKYCLKKFEIDKAVSMAKRALEIFQILDHKERSYTSATQYVFGKALYVHACYGAVTTMREDVRRRAYSRCRRLLWKYARVVQRLDPEVAGSEHSVCNITSDE